MPMNSMNSLNILRERPRWSAVLLVTALSLGACTNLDTRFDRSELEREDAGLIIGEYPLKPNAIVDGLPPPICLLTSGGRAWWRCRQWWWIARL